MLKKGALAIFVKTPGRSPIKTRLAESIGAKAAEEFYRLSLAAVEEIVGEAADAHGNVEPYWAVAEDDAVDDPLWRSFQRVRQGPGELGERLHRVYDELLRKHSFVLLIGADSPQLMPESLGQAAERVDLSPLAFILGRADDGGFYLFGGSIKLPRKLWISVPYSVPETSDELVSHLQPYGEVFDWDPLFDVDTVEELRRLGEHFDAADALLPAQNTLADWIAEHLPSKSPAQ
jgi:glycosyltransferase A (GT-A) superfamily protein (DUF2064 family)